MKTTPPTFGQRISNLPSASDEQTTALLPDEGHLRLAAAVLELPQEVVLARMLSGIPSLEPDRATTKATAVLIS